MVDLVTIRKIVDGPKNAVIALTSVSDGTGEAAVIKVDVSTLSGAPTTVSIKRIRYNVTGMLVSLLEDADTDVRILDLQGDGVIDCEPFGGIPNSKAAGYTGDILLTTTGHSNGDSYSLVLELTK